MFLEGVKAALTADAKFNGGEYKADDPPVVGLKACARVYAGEHLSQSKSHPPSPSCSQMACRATCTA